MYSHYPSEHHVVHEPPLKRGKVLPDKRKLPQEWPGKSTNKRSGSSNLQDPNLGPSSSSTLTPCQRQNWARLLHQRHPPILDLAQLPDDLLFRVTGFLDTPSLLKMRGLNRRYSELCARDEAGWDRLCSKLWEDKVHVPEMEVRLSCSPSTPSDNSMMQAYRFSMQDARDRQSILPEELCYDPVNHKGTVWSFRFKISAGADWTTADPWYNGEPCRKMVFLNDGTVKQYVKGTASLEAPRFGTPATALRAQAGAPEEGDLQQHHHHRPNNNNMVAANNPVSMTWRFISRPMDLPNRPTGGYVRISVGGRDVPTYSVRRSPTGNWGFVMESCWGLFASFEMPPRIIPRPLRLRTTMQRNTNGWVDILLDESDSEEESEDGVLLDEEVLLVRSRQSSTHEREVDPYLVLRDDSFMVITNEIQWREAFLYNLGARILPDGEEATDEFDRAWGSTGSF